jgi:hypothetical protein
VDFCAAHHELARREGVQMGLPESQTGERPTGGEASGAG